MGVEENGETNQDTNITICDNDEQLIPRRPNRSNSLYGGNSDIDNDPGDLVLRTPRSMVRRMVQYSHPTLRGKRNLSNPKPPLMIPSISTNTKQAQFLFFIFLFYLFINYYYYYYFLHRTTKAGRMPHQHSPTKRTPNLQSQLVPST